MNSDERLTSAIEIYTASWVAGFAAAHAGLDWRACWFSSIDAGLGFKDGALAYERSPARHRPNAPLGPAH
jgi:heme A synthase